MGSVFLVPLAEGQQCKKDVSVMALIGKVIGKHPIDLLEVEDFRRECLGIIQRFCNKLPQPRVVTDHPVEP